MRQKVLRSLAIAATRAGATKVELLDSDNEMVRGLAGIRPESAPSVNISLEVKAGYVIDLQEDHEIEAKALPHNTVDHKPAPIE